MSLLKSCNLVNEMIQTLYYNTFFMIACVINLSMTYHRWKLDLENSNIKNYL